MTRLMKLNTPNVIFEHRKQMLYTISNT